MVPVEFVAKELGADCHREDATSTFSIETHVFGSMPGDMHR